MSLYGMMRTGVSGMAAQANRLSSVADNIANANTTGYKRSKTEFSSLIVPNTPGNYNSGGVQTSVRYEISRQGVLQYTTSGSDLAVNGEGFFIVQSSNGSIALTRAGSFVPDGNGNLVNAAGMHLMGYSYANGDPSVTINGFNGLEPINITVHDLKAKPSANGALRANLPSTAEIVPGVIVPPVSLPSANAANSSYTAKSSIVVYDNLGSQILLDVYMTKTADNAWEVSVYNQADAAPDTSFPYANAALLTATLGFDGTNGKLTTGGTQTITVPNGETMNLDLSAMTQLAANYNVGEFTQDGYAPRPIDQVNIAEDGTVYALYEDGSMRALYRIPLATAQSPDLLTPLSGNLYAQSPGSGDLHLGFPNSSGFGSVISGALEGSNVDIAEELTTMIESQRNYTANSKVFQTGSELMDVLVNLKR